LDLKIFWKNAIIRFDDLSFICPNILSFFFIKFENVLKYEFIFIKSLKYKTIEYAKICKIKILLFDSVEHESYLYTGPNKIRLIEKNVLFHKHPNPSSK
jgi:hypothetical protein